MRMRVDLQIVCAHVPTLLTFRVCFACLYKNEV